MNIHSQNLVPNGNFERHYSFDIPGPNIGSPGFLYDWKKLNHLGWTYCHKDFVKRFGQEKLKRGGRFVNFDTTHIFEGDAMVKLFYLENETTYDTGCSSYIKTKLISPMEVGEVYEISMWVMSPFNPSADTAVYSHFGMYVTRNEIFDMKINRIATDYYFGQQIYPGQWMELKWYIRALCNLQHITIGAFRDYSFPSLMRWIDNPVTFYVDKVSIQRVDPDTITAIISPTPYCEFYEKEEKEAVLQSITSLSVHFESNKVDLFGKDTLRIDSFYQANIESLNKQFLIIGHADSESGDNLSLSLARANRVKQYLQSKYSLSDLRFLVYGVGSSVPLADNGSAKGRSLNRRTTISTSDITFPQVIYRKALESIAEDSLKKANVLLARWISHVAFSKRIEMLTDPRLIKLKRSRYWSGLVTQIKKGYTVYTEPLHAFYLDSLYFEDQRCRISNYYKLSGFIEEIDTVVLSELKVTKEGCEKNDSLNYYAIQQYASDKGYPTIARVGRRAAKGFWSIILHSSDSIAYKKYIPILEQLCTEGEAEWAHFACMTDQLQVMKKQPQIFGTQYVRDADGQSRLYRVEDINQVNRRRERIGLTPALKDD